MISGFFRNLLIKIDDYNLLQYFPELLKILLMELINTESLNYQFELKVY